MTSIRPAVGARSRAPRPAVVLAAIALVLIVAGSAAVLVAHLGGVRWFEVETPSMGRAAPVGTLVVTTPVAPADLRVGDVIAFVPPTAGGRTYTHRIVAIAADGSLRTRGDLNGATDGWSITPAAVVGRAALLLPGAGFLLRGLPLLLVGNAVVWLATALIREPAPRQALRLVGFSLVVALAGLVLKPFVHLQVLAVSAAQGAVDATVVSTGLLPVTAHTAGGGDSVMLRAGQSGTLTMPIGEDGYRLSAALDLQPLAWVALVAICLVPLAVALVVGLPGGGDEQEPA